MASDQHRTGHNLSHQLLGKVDRAGRLISEDTKFAIFQAKFRVAPDHEFWMDWADADKVTLKGLLSEEEYSTWRDSLPFEDSEMAHYDVCHAKLKEVQEQKIKELRREENE